MNIDKFQDAISACRFCFMCRHLSAVGNVSFKESDTPRGRALMADKVRMERPALSNPDFIESFYRADLSASCRRHCVSHYDETSLILSMREDIVEAGLEPQRVKELVKTIESSGNPFGATESSLDLKGLPVKAALLYYIDSYTLYKTPEVASAFMEVLKAAGVKFSVVTEASNSGKALLALGFRKAAAKAAKKTASAIMGSGCGTLVSSCPASIDAFKNDYPSLGAALNGIEALHSSQLLAKLLREGKLKAAKGKSSVSFIDSDFLRNYLKIESAPREALAAAGVSVEEFGTNQEESYSLGEGAVIYDVLNPGLLVKLKAAVLEKRVLGAKERIVVASPYAKHAFTAAGGESLDIASLEETVAERIL